MEVKRSRRSDGKGKTIERGEVEREDSRKGK